ncbi:MAG: efflux RND transporter permease subunit [Phycisphaerae bacterium]
MLQALLRFSVQNRWLVLLLTIAAAAVGAFALKRLPIDAVPDITNVQVQVNTPYPALSPNEIEKQVTFPLENAMAGIPGLESTRSLSRNGFSQITAVFEDGTDIWFARQQVKERLDEAKENLPPGAEPAMGPVSTGLGEIYMYVVRYGHPGGKGATPLEGQPGWQKNGVYLTPEGERLTTPEQQASYLRTVQDWIISPQLRNVVGVAGVDSIGGYQKQYAVQPDPMKLVSYGLTFSDVIDALEKNNVSTGAGFLEHKGEIYLVRAAARIESQEEIGQIVVGTRGGTPIHVRDVAEVSIGKELRTGAASQNGKEVVVGTGLMLIGGNSRTIAAAVDTKMKQVNKTLPPDVEAQTVLNRTKFVNRTVETVQGNLVEGAVFVIAVFVLLLGNVRAALIIAAMIPLAMLMTAIGMVRTGTTGNLLSLGAIDFGIIVDGAVFIVENCLRALGHKQHELKRPLTLPERLHEVTNASSQMVRPVAFGQAIIMTVYVPLLALTGIEGKMFEPMGVTVLFALLAAFVLSFTFLPAMVAICMRGKVTEKENFLVRGAGRLYRPALAWTVRWRYAVLAGAVVLFGASAWLFGRLGQEFIPSLDEGNIAIQMLRIPSTSLTESLRIQQAAEEKLESFPEVAFIFSKTGTAELASDPMPQNATDTFVILKSRDQWPDPREEKNHLIGRMEEALSEVPGNSMEFTQPIQMRFNELIAGTRGDIAVKVFGEDFDKMVPVADQIAKVLRSIPGSADVKVEQTSGLPVMNIQIDRLAAARYGLNISDVQDVIATALGGREAGQVFQGDKRFDLVVRLPDHLRQQFDKIGSIPVPLPSQEGEAPVALASVHEGAPAAVKAFPYVPLGSIAKITVAEGPNQISRENGKRRVVVQTNVRGRDIGSFVEEAQGKIEAQVKFPPGTWLTWGGQFENLAAARARLSLVVPVCFFVIFLFLFSSFGSLKYAVMVFACVPLALTGGIIALWLRDMPFSISAAVGFIALSGVAVLNGLVMVSYINQLRQEGMSLEDAVLQGPSVRLRPVLMTAMVAIVGFVPMALAHGAGAEVQKPLATVVIGGLVSATLLTLFVLPALYRWWHRVPALSPGRSERSRVATQPTGGAV